MFVMTDMTETTAQPRWREALNDRNHPLYRAAWTIFSERSTPEVAKERLAAEQEVVVPFLLEILKDDLLFDADALGKGVAPANAIKLLGEWQVRDALPTLFEVLADSTGYLTRNACIDAIANFGSEIMEQVIAWAAEDEANRPKAGEILAEIGQGNPQAFQTILAWLTPETTGPEYYARYLIKINPEEAAAVLAQLSKDRRFSDPTRQRFKDRLKEAKEAIRQKNASA
jgi:HEAT repeat protein